MEPRALWDAVAPAWDRNRARLFESTRALSDWLIEQVEPGPDRTILEITAGAGETSFLAAARGGTIFCSDFAPGMVEAARREASARGITNVECRVMDAQHLDLADASVDGVMSRYGMMLIPDPGAAASQAHRVLSPGARFAYTVPAPADRNPWAGLIAVAAVQCGHEMPSGDPLGPGGMFSLSTADRNSDLVRAAGFASVEVDSMMIPQLFADFDDYWRFRLEVSGIMQRLMASLNDEQIRGIYETAQELAESYAEPDGSLAFPSESLCVLAQKP